MDSEQTNGNAWRSVAAGAVGGLLASLAMNQFQAIWTSAAQALSGEKKQSGGGGDDATEKTAKFISENVFDHQLSDEEKSWAGPAVHYGFGTAMGAVYGALVHSGGIAQAGRGAAFGAALWLGADEIAVPAFGLSGPPTETPLPTHIQTLAAHLVYGFVTDLVRRTALPEAQ